MKPNLNKYCYIAIYKYMGTQKTSGFTERQNQIAAWSGVLSNPGRVAILEYIMLSKGCICKDIVQELPLAQPTISLHLKELKRVGLIIGNIEGREICYCINPEKWADLENHFKQWFEGYNPATLTCCK